MFSVWPRQRRGGATRQPASAAAGPSGAPAEQTFPVPVVPVHGVLAATTVLLVLLTALGVGG